jgi:hypothetical protein
MCTDNLQIQSTTATIAVLGENLGQVRSGGHSAWGILSTWEWNFSIASTNMVEKQGSHDHLYWFSIAKCKDCTMEMEHLGRESSS